MKMSALRVIPTTAEPDAFAFSAARSAAITPGRLARSVSAVDQREGGPLPDHARAGVAP